MVATRRIDIVAMRLTDIFIISYLIYVI